MRASLPGGNSEREPPDPIPNSEVKLLSADGSVGFPHVRVGHCQASKSKAPVGSSRQGLFYWRLTWGNPTHCLCGVLCGVAGLTRARGSRFAIASLRDSHLRVSTHASRVTARHLIKSPRRYSAGAFLFGGHMGKPHALSMWGFVRRCGSDPRSRQRASRLRRCATHICVFRHTQVGSLPGI